MSTKGLTPDRVRICWERLQRWRPELTTDAWWGVVDPFERAIGAVLVQRTTWRQAYQALFILRQNGYTTPETLTSLEEHTLHPYIRAAGFYRAKAATLIRLAAWWVRQGGERELARQSDLSLRRQLLALSGIGPETADLILSDALGRTTFVVDAYSHRIWSRWLKLADWDGDAIRRTVVEAFDDPRKCSRLHAWLVELGKEHCHKGSPRCFGCPLQQSCVYYRGKSREG
jgi:endonuclease-3 related protein